MCEMAAEDVSSLDLLRDEHLRLMAIDQDWIPPAGDEAVREAFHRGFGDFEVALKRLDRVLQMQGIADKVCSLRELLEKWDKTTQPGFEARLLPLITNKVI